MMGRSMLFRSLRNFHPASQPLMARPSYAHELVTASTFPMAVAVLESGVIGVLAKKTFHVSEFELATIMAAPIFANLTSFMWAMLARGRRKVRFISALQASVLMLLVVISFLPTVKPGPAMLVTAVVLTRCALAGVVTLRSTVWRQNYPVARRAQITGRFTVLASLIIALGPLVGFFIQDLSPDSFRWLYRVVAVIAAVGVVSFSRIRLRGEKHLLGFERQSTAKPQPHGDPGRVYAFEPDGQTRQKHTAWSILREDRNYRWYMVWQFVGGMANLIGNFALISLVIRLTENMKYEYAVSILLTTTIPMAVAMTTVSPWARYLDKVHITRFRTRQGLLWIAAQLGNWLAGLTGIVGLFALPRIIDGTSRGGGMLAWNLGHNDFADRRMVPLYMGIHVTLTGVRGFLAPYLAVTLLYGWTPNALPGLTLPAFTGIGAHVFLVTTVLALIAEIGFVRLRKTVERQQADESV
jgi:Major Facilitator Superfamily